MINRLNNLASIVPKLHCFSRVPFTVSPSFPLTTIRMLYISRPMISSILLRTVLNGQVFRSTVINIVVNIVATYYLVVERDRTKRLCFDVGIYKRFYRTEFCGEDIASRSLVIPSRARPLYKTGKIQIKFFVAEVRISTCDCRAFYFVSIVVYNDEMRKKQTRTMANAYYIIRIEMKRIIRRRCSFFY